MGATGSLLDILAIFHPPITNRAWLFAFKVGTGLVIPALKLVREGREMEKQVDAQSIIMEDLVPPSKFPGEQRCMQIKGIAKEVKIFNIRKDYVYWMLELEQTDRSQTTETKVKLEA
ncbi:hypothetical protein TNCV_1092641 [Trichonephila clavipes]|nr:hypothetical protein TNCV_1092641 [Trichonephila clavipes]